MKQASLAWDVRKSAETSWRRRRPWTSISWSEMHGSSRPQVMICQPGSCSTKNLFSLTSAMRSAVTKKLWHRMDLELLLKSRLCKHFSIPSSFKRSQYSSSNSSTWTRSTSQSLSIGAPSLNKLNRRLVHQVYHPYQKINLHEASTSSKTNHLLPTKFRHLNSTPCKFYKNYPKVYKLP